MQGRDGVQWLAVAGLFSMVCGTARADGLADLNAALARLQGLSPVKAQVESKSWRKEGEGKEAEEDSGQATVAVESGPAGLQVLYGKDLLAKVEAEQRAKVKDPKVKTPIGFALGEMKATELRAMVSAAGALSREIDEAVFSSEKADSYKGKPARLLSFTLSLDKVPEKDRKYVKKFDGGIEVWIAADGTPLASQFHIDVSGRAFVVVSFTQKTDETRQYGVQGDRLLLLRKESRNTTSGAGEKVESKIVKTLQLQS
ncbi:MULTISPECIES: hypothetical protein [Janthinobacterium]|uniref:Uncharacterized protein n=1 Tax=Janthinobacterium violaceinigrum TaxID=2654252 RepID=A0A6I1I6G7_9BURK|nr:MULTISPECIES: hypothetical protein [Janthinobacterium]KAB8063087.1 hypothetical protein GCN75_20000 [Janthinobacterium violaceinigrum]MCX7291566.1 hypothetical protein [Janthinobacterium sp.]